MNQLLESLRQNSSLRYKELRHFIPLQISGVLPKIGPSLSRGVNWVNYYGGLGTTLAAVAGFITLLFVVDQTTSLKEQVKLTEESLKLVNRQTQISLAVTRPFVYILPSRNKNLTEWGYNAVNTGDIPARIIAKNIKVQAGNRLWETGPIPETLIVSKDNKDLYAGLQRITEDTAQNVRTGKVTLKMAACIVYKSVDNDDPRKWIAISKDVYDSNFGKFTMKFRDVQNVSSDPQSCFVELPSSN
jgi:hypothetical protein